MRILGLDVGEKRIGVAKLDTSVKIALPLTTISVDGSEWDEISRLARLYSTNFFVLGLPRSNEGNETKQSLYVRNFAKTLVEKIPGAKIHFQDESLTSVEAENRLKSRKKSYEKGEIDAEAASIILQDFAESFREYVPEDKKTNFVEKKAQKVALETKKMKHKTKNLIRKLIVAPIFAVALAAAVVVAIVTIKNYRAEQRAAEYARLEAEMTAEVFDFTILPGETIFDIKENLEKVGYEKAEIDDAFEKIYENYKSILPNREISPLALEGYLFGETFEFYKTATVEEIIATFLDNSQKIIEENDLKKKFAAQGLTLDEGIILASIVQKEATGDARPIVAQIFLTRLDNNIPLGSDVTVSYALEAIDPNREIYTDNTSALKIDSCYNTRLYSGLPCGAISSPSLSALLAVAEPANTSYLYFLTGDDGLMYYSYTDSEHTRNIYLHCQELCNASL